MSCWTYTRPESDFYSVFGDNPVPIRSIVPIVPREEGCPPCYVVLVEQLEVQQAEALAQRLYQKWQPECESIEQARQYILDGLPLQTSHFSGCGTDDYFMVAHAFALNIAENMAKKQE